MLGNDTDFTLLEKPEYNSATVGHHRNGAIKAIFNDSERWILTRRDGDEVLTVADSWEPAGTLLSRNVSPAKAMIFSSPEAALNHLRCISPL